MKALLFAVMAMLCIGLTVPAPAQNMDIAVFATSPQSDDGKMVSDRTFGGGVSATYVHTAINSFLKPVGTLQYHRHSDTNKDVLLAGGLRVNLLDLYGQWTAGAVEKRDTMSMDNRSVELVLIGSVGYMIGDQVGAQASYYYGKLGKHYGAGVVLRF